MGITRMLITSNKTRFTSMHASEESVLWLQLALQELARQRPECLADQLLDWFSDDMFFIMIKQLCKILEPFTLVFKAVEAACATLADVIRFWLYLAKMITQLPFQSIDSAFRKWCCIAFNMRQADAQPYVQVGFVLCIQGTEMHLLAAQACGRKSLWRLVCCGSVMASTQTCSCSQTWSSTDCMKLLIPVFLQMVS
ncbi:TPA: hypothetical protein ACH3X1_000177 [Trebouxia sp. C0004]